MSDTPAPADATDEQLGAELRVVVEGRARARAERDQNSALIRVLEARNHSLLEESLALGRRIDVLLGNPYG